MDLNKFDSDAKIIKYLQSQIDKISSVDECRLFREEQLRISEEMIYFRNCIEWLIRSNQLIENIKYALTQCTAFAKSMEWPLEETENKRLYAYYLEDAVYRNQVLWDMVKQLLNEYYKCGYAENDNISIFKFLKDNKIELGVKRATKLLNYLNCAEHKMVRNDLRNSFTHSVDTTSSYVFHRKINGKIQPQLEYVIPKHPFENIECVIKDTIRLIEFIKEVAKEMNNYRNDNLALYQVTTIMPCGKRIDDIDYWNLSMLREKYERMFIPCDDLCEKAHTYNDINVCKPVSVCYNRINTKQGKCDGVITPEKSFEEIQELFGEDIK